MAAFKTKHTHASVADLLPIRIGSLNWNESYEYESYEYVVPFFENILFGEFMGTTAMFQFWETESYYF